MSDQPNLKDLLAECDLLDRAEAIDDSTYRLRWGSAMVVVGLYEHAVVAIAPMFKDLPAGKEGAFCRRLLELSSTLGGVAGFAIQPDGWVVLQGGRDVRGMDARELHALVTAVARSADHFDDMLHGEFFASGKGNGGVWPHAPEDAPEDGQEAGPQDGASQAGTPPGEA